MIVKLETEQITWEKKRILRFTGKQGNGTSIVIEVTHDSDINYPFELGNTYDSDSVINRHPIL